MLKHSSNSVCLKWTHVCLEFLNPQFSFTLMNGTTITIAVSYSSLKWSRYFKFLLSSLLHYSIHTFLVCPPSKYTSFNFIRVAASLKHFNGSLLYLELNSFSLRWPPRSLFLLLQCPHRFPGLLCVYQTCQVFAHLWAFDSLLSPPGSASLSFTQLALPHYSSHRSRDTYSERPPLITSSEMVPPIWYLQPAESILCLYG